MKNEKFKRNPHLEHEKYNQITTAQPYKAFYSLSPA